MGMADAPPFLWSKNASSFYLSQTWQPWGKSTSKYNSLSKRWTFRPQGTNGVDNHENGHEHNHWIPNHFVPVLSIEISESNTDEYL
jgi:hypothetical protein